MISFLSRAWLGALFILRYPFGSSEVGGRGQVAIFAALIFQVLFIFFAMVVNVGLLVHHKINLQNSVDLAAYYGAMKQAETLNAISHVNFQIRQSWKLMAFRYRGIGMAGNEKTDAPFDFLKNTMRASGNTDQAYSCAASFCSNYPAWDVMNKENKENYCKDMCDGQKITLPGQPFGASLLAGLLSAALPGITAAVDQISQIANAKVKEQCEQKSALNWFALGRYIFAYKNDVANRKRVINKIANGLSHDEKDFLDLDGESARAGALKTLWKNMTYQNQASIDPTTGTGEGSFEFFNSLAAGGCGGQKDDEKTPPAWLSEIFAKPIYAYSDGFCRGEGGEVTFRMKPFNVGEGDNLPQYKDRLDANVIQFILSYAKDPLSFDSPEARLYHTTLGYEKNPWCMAYVRVKATTKPKIPFSPFGGVVLKASAVAKPFGGKIGPWYYKSWPQSANQSTGSKEQQVDKNLPPRVRAGESPTDLGDDYLRIDYSRYVGDTIGVKSTLTMGHMHKVIFAKHGPEATPQISFSWFNHLMDMNSDLNSLSSNGDILAWDPAGSAPALRTIEIGAVIPDQFDVANYSVEPFFWRTYAQRIQKRKDFSSLNVRGDLGFRKDAPEPWSTFSVKDQMQKALSENILDFNGALTYVAGRTKPADKSYGELLTNWHTKVPGDYVLDERRFGNCDDAGFIGGVATDVDKAVPGNCIAGGRAGYSVKIVDPEFLVGDQELGGSGNSGRIKNPPPN